MKQFFDRMFENYSEEDGNAWGINWRSSHYKRIKDAIDVMLLILEKQQIDILEAGCATGDMTELILQHIKDLNIYDAFDISEKAISICQNKRIDKNCQWFVGDLSNLRLDKKYDIIICCDVIYYLPSYQQKKCIDDFYNYLKKQGWVFLGVPYEQREVDRLIKFKGKFNIECERKEHLWLWCRIESELLRWYKQLKGQQIRKILRAIISNHKLMECFVWINKMILPNKYSHMYMLLKKNEG